MDKVCPKMSKVVTNTNTCPGSKGYMQEQTYLKEVYCQKERCQLWIGRDYSPGKAEEAHCGLIKEERQDEDSKTG